MRPFRVSIPLKSDIKYIERLILDGSKFKISPDKEFEDMYTITVKSGKGYWLDIDRDPEYGHIEVSFGFGATHFLEYFGFMRDEIPEGCKWVWPEKWCDTSV